MKHFKCHYNTKRISLMKESRKKGTFCSTAKCQPVTPERIVTDRMTLSESQTQSFDIISMYNCAFLGVSSTSTIFCSYFLSFSRSLSVSPSVENNRLGTLRLLIMKILGTMLLLMIQLPLFFSPFLCQSTSIKKQFHFGSLYLSFCYFPFLLHEQL